MNRQQAAQACRDELNKHGLQKWGVRLNMNANSSWLGMCSHKDSAIFLNAHHIDMHPDPDVINTIRHEVAHALTPFHGHDEVWIAKAKECGCDNTLPCSNLSLNPAIIDAIRSGADVEVTFDEHVIRTPKFTVTRLQDKCPECGKVAKTVKERTVVTKIDTEPDIRYITMECGHTIVKWIPKGTPFHTFQFGGDPKCEHLWDKNECKKCGRFRPYGFQLEGMQFLEAGLAVNKGAACCDEMGLGKTIQAAGVLHFHKELWPVLWIVKAGLKYQAAKVVVNWMDEVPQIINTSNDVLFPRIQHYIVGYDMLVPKVRQLKNGKTATQGFDITKFDKRGIKTVILDECQQIKNVDSTRTQMVRRVVRDKKVIPLSGTPWNNRGSELFPMLNMIDPMKFHSEEGFRRGWVNMYWQGNRQVEGGIRNIKAFREATKDLIIRRERAEVMPELPPVRRTKLYVKMDREQETVYDAAVEEFVEWYEAQAENIAGMHILAAMTKMRHLCAVAKVPATLDYVDEFVEDTDRKLVVFAHHKDVQFMLYEECNERYSSEFPVLKLTAEMSAIDRNHCQDKFNESPRCILIASQLAAGEGLNLQTGADLVMHERQWNPGKEEQCEGRFPRPGQTASSINAVYTHLEGLTTIDPKLDGIVETKRINFHNSMNKGEMQAWNENAMAKELAESIIRAHKAKKNRKAS